MGRLQNIFIATLVLGLSLSSSAAQTNNKSSVSDSGVGTITGRVVAQGKPLPGAIITLWRQPLAEPTSSNLAVTGQTNAEGAYELTEVPSGNYLISAHATGFVTGKENQVFENLRPVVIAGQGVTRVDFELVPEAIIKGRVTDGDGKPLAHMPITIFPESLSPPDTVPPLYARNIRTDNGGTYRIDGIPAGRYRIAAGYYPVSTITLFGRDGYRRVLSRFIEISPGSELTNVDFNLGHPVKTFSVTARVVDDQTGKPVEDINYLVEVFENGKRIGGASPRGRSNNRGEITLASVPSGEYMIRVPGGVGSIPAGEVPPAPNIFGESKHFEVTDGDVTDIEIRVVRAATVSGVVVVEGPASSEILNKLSQMRIIAMVMPKPGGRSTPMRWANIKPDGSFVFTGLLPGKLQFNFDGPREGLPPLRPVRVERDGVRLDQDPDIEAGDNITGLRVVLGYANSGIHGVVKFDNGPLPPGIIAKASVLQYGKVVGGASLDPRGEFILQNLSAGEYTLGVSAHDATRYWRVEQQITIPDDRVSEATMVLESSKVNQIGNPITRPPR